MARDRLDKPVIMDRLEIETLSMLQKSNKLQEKKLTISAGVRRSKFVFNTRGELTKK